MNNFSILPADQDNCELLSVLFKTVYIDTYGTEGVTYEFANFIESQFCPTKIKEDIRSKQSDLWVAYYKNNPVGIIQVEYKKVCPIAKIIYPEINKLYILHHFFGNGLGQKLMSAAEKEVQKRGQKNVWLWVLESNKRAINFYHKQGYENIGTADFQMEENKYKNIVMRKSL